MTKKITFVVQGEGRGHLSQALAMNEILEKLGVELVSVYVGSSSFRQLPQYFTERFGQKIHEFKSPNFSKDKNDKGIQVGKSLFLGIVNLPRYIAIGVGLAKRIKKENVDLIINFYEPLIGLSQLFYRLKIPIICVAHQYLAMSPNFVLPRKPHFDRIGLQNLTYITQIGSAQKWALSFYPAESFFKKNIIVVPPLLRNKIFHLKPNSGNYYLIYILNSGYAQNVIDWQKTQPQTEIHCFWDRFVLPNPYSPQQNLYFHHLSENGFLEKMAGCKALITTAGFESVSEAIYLQKPVAMVPVEGHYEQKVNSFDALLAHAGVRYDSFDIQALMEKLQNFKADIRQENQAWIASSAKQFEELLAKALEIFV